MFFFFFSCVRVCVWLQSVRYADIIIPWHDGPHNDIAIEILVQHINTEVYKRGLAIEPEQPPQQQPIKIPTAVAPLRRKNL